MPPPLYSGCMRDLVHSSGYVSISHTAVNRNVRVSKKFLPPAWRIRFWITSTPRLLLGGSRSRIGLTSASVTGWVHSGGGVVGWLSSFTSCSTLSASGSSNGDRWWFLWWWPSANPKLPPCSCCVRSCFGWFLQAFPCYWED